jgi:hypothetical protein
MSAWNLKKMIHNLTIMLSSLLFFTLGYAELDEMGEVSWKMIVTFFKYYNFWIFVRFRSILWGTFGAISGKWNLNLSTDGHT